MVGLERNLPLEEPQISPLRYPGFPVEFGGVGDLPAAFPNERLKRGHVERCVTGNPRTLGRKTFPGRGVNTEISPLRFAPVEMTKGKGTVR
jgi:hypothetical protein